MANTYLYRQVSSSATNKNKVTISLWFKKCTTGVEETLISGYMTDTNRWKIRFKSDDTLDAEFGYGGTWYSLRTNRKFRDTSAWYHCVVAYDTTQGTASERAKMYINGIQETSFQTEAYPPQNYGIYLVENTAQVGIGRGYYSGSYQSNTNWSGLISHLHVTDGYTYPASTFGEYDANGVWTINTSPSVTYGTNGFFILKDGNSVTDQSGNSNNFTVGGGTLTNTEDSPSNVFATLNPLIINNFLLPNMTYAATSEGNNTLTGTSATNNGHCYSTLGASSGKFYCEVKIITTIGGYPFIGIMPEEGLIPTSSSIYGLVGYDFADTVSYERSGDKRINSSASSFGDTYGLNDIIGIAMDLDNGAVYFSKNGTFQNSGNPTSGASKTGAALTFTANNKNYFFGGTAYTTSTQIKVNFGNGYFGTTAVASAGTNASGIGIFEYDVPTGFTALSTKGLNL